MTTLIFLKALYVNLNIFKKIIKVAELLKVIVAPIGKEDLDHFFDKLNNWAKEEGASGLGYMTFSQEDEGLVGKGLLQKI